MYQFISFKSVSDGNRLVDCKISWHLPMPVANVALLNYYFSQEQYGVFPVNYPYCGGLQCFFYLNYLFFYV